MAEPADHMRHDHLRRSTPDVADGREQGEGCSRGRVSKGVGLPQRPRCEVAAGTAFIGEPQAEEIASWTHTRRVFIFYGRFAHTVGSPHPRPPRPPPMILTATTILPNVGFACTPSCTTTMKTEPLHLSISFPSSSAVGCMNRVKVPVSCVILGWALFGSGPKHLVAPSLLRSACRP